MSEQITYRKIAKIGIPVIFANVLLPLQGLIDTAIVGHFSDSAYLSGLGLANGIFALIYASFNFLQYATSGLTSQAFGAKNYLRMQRILWRGLITASFIGILLIVLRPFLIILANLYYQAPLDSSKIMDSYIHTRLWGSVGELGLYCSIGWFAAQGLGKYILYQQVILTAVNIIASVALVYGFHLGIEGLAAGTVIAAYIALAVAIYLIVKRQCTFQLHFFQSSWKEIFQWQEIKKLLGLNRDLFIRTLCLTLSLSWFSRLAAHQSSTALAANVILLGLANIAAYGLDGVCVAAESFTGRAIGAKNTQAFHLVLRKTLIAGGLLSFIFVAIFTVTMRPYLHVMTNLIEVQNYAFDYAWWAIILPFIMVWSFLADGYFIGATKSTYMRNTMLLVLIITIPASTALTFFFGTLGIWIGIYLFYILRATFLFYRIPHLF